MDIHNLSKNRLELALEAADLDLWENNLLTGEVTLKATRVFNELGYNEDEIPNFINNLLLLVHPEDVPKVEAAIDEHFTGKTPKYRCEFRLRTKKGNWVWYANYGRIIKDANGEHGHRFVGVTANIDERRRKQAEFEIINRRLADTNRRLIKSEKAHLISQRIAGLGNYELDLATGNWTSSSGLEKIFGIPESYPHSTEGWKALIHPEDRKMMVDYFNDMVRYRHERFDKEYRIIRHSDKSVRWLHGLGSFELDINGKPIKLFGTIRDITDLREAEHKLKTSEERYRKVVQASPDAIAITRQSDGVYLDANHAFEKIVGYKKRELVGKTSLELNIWQNPEDRLRLIEQLKQTGICENLEAVFITKSGVPFNGLMSGVIIDIDNTPCVITITRDITQRKISELKVRRLSRFYAVLSQCNQSIMRAANEAELFPQVCRDAVKFGEMKMAWFGMIDDVTKQVTPVAAYGDTEGYLDHININLNPDSSFGRGSEGLSIQENKPVWIQEFLHDSLTSPWHQRAYEYGFRAAAILPVQRKGATVGCFALYSTEAFVFDGDEQRLLIELAQDISYALDNFDNLTARKQALKQVSLQNTLLTALLETSLDAIYVVDQYGEVAYYNHQFINLWHIPETVIHSGKDSSLLNFVIDKVVDGDQFFSRVQYLYEHPEEKSSDEVFFKDGRIIDRYSSPIFNENNHYYGRIWYFRDITERKQSEKQIRYLANFDPLTGLPNRSQLSEHLKFLVNRTKRQGGQFAVLFVDIDHFKNINDSLGHSIGDAVLIEIAQRLQAALREEDLIARLGGDEFILLLPDSESRGTARVAEKLLNTISEGFVAEQYELAVTASIGVAQYPDDGEDVESLLKSADTAMYRAKQGGRNLYRFFTAEMQTSAVRNMQLLNAMRTALGQDQFHLHFQPQVSLLDGRIIGVEALLRWTHPTLGSISPAEFIPIAEDSGLILSIGEWVLRTALRQLKAWMDAGHPPVIMAVNLSAVQFRHPSLPDLITKVLQEEQVAPEYLELELTEGTAMHDPFKAIKMIDNLHDRGIRMSIDDFGTGYSSLNYLKKFKVYKVKIDQSFVRDISTDLEDKAIVAAIISMSQKLGLKTIAEGVETTEQLAYLREQGCDEAQGYYLSKPLPADQFESFLEQYRGI